MVRQRANDQAYESASGRKDCLDALTLKRLIWPLIELARGDSDRSENNAAATSWPATTLAIGRVVQLAGFPIHRLPIGQRRPRWPPVWRVSIC